MRVLLMGALCFGGLSCAANAGSNGGSSADAVAGTDVIQADPDVGSAPDTSDPVADVAEEPDTPEPGDTGPPDAGETSDIPETPDTALPDAGSPDAGSPDALDAVEPPDSGPPDVGASDADDGPEWCASDADCQLGCIPTSQGMQCATPCSAGCDEGFECTDVDFGDGLLLFLCIEPGAQSCKPCSDDTQCALPGGVYPSTCTEFADGAGSFCALQCGGDVGCPSGFGCDAGLCMPTSGTCTCSPLAIGQEATTACGIEACSGTAICHEDGSVLCDAPEWSAEVCDGADNDCDNAIDEGFSDLDADGIKDCLDDDLDGDGVPNDSDNCPHTANTNQADEDLDGKGDACSSAGCNPEAVDAIVVDTELDGFVNDGFCSLREAIQAANTDAAVDGCAAGSGLDVVVVDVAATLEISVPGLYEDLNQAGDFDITTDLIVEGCGNTLNAGFFDRHFEVHAGAVVVIRDLAMEQGKLTGGAGAIPAPGQLAAFGGAIRSAGDLTLANCSFTGNSVVGGKGSDGSSPGGGGGGGGSAGLGGAIFSDGPALTLIADGGLCTFTSNQAVGGLGGNGKANGGSFSGNGGGGGGPNGGAGGSPAAGAAAGWGGGGGGGAGSSSGTIGGAGGFAGGGGGGGAKTGGGDGGVGGAAGFGAGAGGKGCCSAAAGGGGGAGMGGAIFAREGTLSITGCTFASNMALGGGKGSNAFGGPAAIAGGGYGGAIFADGTAVTHSETTFSENAADTDGEDQFDW
ncbi:MAG: CSLREA domain-containing protein [Myxococcota bacterium]|jgi:CSLREA domain-containing protein